MKNSTASAHALKVQPVTLCALVQFAYTSKHLTLRQRTRLLQLEVVPLMLLTETAACRQLTTATL
jgi:hypothetical protein